VLMAMSGQFVNGRLQFFEGTALSFARQAVCGMQDAARA
jgi:hypothetical protein